MELLQLIECCFSVDAVVHVSPKAASRKLLVCYLISRRKEGPRHEHGSEARVAVATGVWARGLRGDKGMFQTPIFSVLGC